jgi:hypothetical protein
VTKFDSPQKLPDRTLDVGAVADQIVRNQLPSGEIPWHRGGKSDPWDHVEAAMGLSIGGYPVEALRAYEWLVSCQNRDGSWFSAYKQGQPIDKTRDANMSSYIAVGIWHYYLITADDSFLKRMWPTVQAAVEFALGLQSPHGEIFWAISPAGHTDPMALLTGSSSIRMSIRCALAIAARIGARKTSWKNGLARLDNAIKTMPHRFNMTKSRYSMDWFYPVLCGALTGEQARKRIDQHWKRFVIENAGVRCVYDQPWVTIAETSELSLALSAMGNAMLAGIVFNWIIDRKFADGSYQAGFTHPDMTVWPEEKLTWTNAVVLLAADALYHLTPASRLFYHPPD